VPFRSETEAIREQIRRLEEEARDLDLERTALTGALALKSPRGRWVAFVFATVLVATALGWVVGARLSSERLAAELARLDRSSDDARGRSANAQHACEGNAGALRDELSSCRAQRDWKRRTPAPESAPCRCAAGDPLCKCPFDRGAAASALGSVDVSRCFAPLRSATFHAKLTFEGKSGGIQTVQVDSGDLTELEKRCVVRAIQGAKVPPFAHDAFVLVGKSFTVRGPQ
jgi:hypothetical protein